MTMATDQILVRQEATDESLASGMGADTRVRFEVLHCLGVAGPALYITAIDPELGDDEPIEVVLSGATALPILRALLAALDRKEVSRADLG